MITYVETEKERKLTTVLIGRNYATLANITAQCKTLCVEKQNLYFLFFQFVRSNTHRIISIVTT